MSAPFVIEYAGEKFARVHVRKPPDDLACEQCGKRIAKGNGCYRCTTWGPDRDRTVYMHQKCLVGQIDPSVWDIPIGGGR